MPPKKLPSGIDELPSGKYRVRIPVEKLPTGKWRYAGGTFTNKKEAEQRRAEIWHAKETGRVDQIDTDLITLAELASEHMRAARPNLEDSTYAVYRSLWIAHVVGRDGKRQHAIADMTLRTITPTVVETFASDRLAAGAGPEAIRKLLALMQTMFDRAVRDERISRNPVALIKKPKAAPPRRVVPTTPEQVEQIRASLADADALMISILAYTAMRPGEARGLRWGDVGTSVLHVWRAVGPSGVKATKTRETRSIPLSKTLRRDLMAWKNIIGSPADDVFIMSRGDGTPWSESDWRNWRKRTFRPAAVAAGVKIDRPYDLRHSAASMWIATGQTIVEVAAWLGNDVAVTMGVYAHVVADRNPNDARSFDQRIEDARRDIPVTYGDVIRRQKTKAAKTRKTPNSRQKEVAA